MKLSIILSLLPSLLTAAPDPSKTLHYDQPAHSWQSEALPIGNGKLGAMTFGGAHSERIQFNEETLWSGSEKEVGYYENFGDLYLHLSDTPLYTQPNSDSQDEREHQALRHATDGDLATEWAVTHYNNSRGTAPVIFQAFFPGRGSVLTSYQLAAKPGKSAPAQWRLQASPDGHAWTTLDQQSRTTPWPKTTALETYTFENSRAYNFYRLVFDNSFANGKKRFAVSEIKLGNTTAKPSPHTNYRRELSLEQGIQTCTYTSGGTNYSRTYFADHRSNTLAFRFAADKPAAFSGSLLLVDPRKTKTTATPTGLSFADKLTRPQGNIAELLYQADLRIEHQGGTITTNNGYLVLQDVDSFTLYLSAGTDFARDRSQGWRRSHPAKRIQQSLDQATKLGFDKLLAQHKRDYQSLFGRFDLSVGNTAPEVAAHPTGTRILNYKNGARDPDLEELMFHYARYLIISSSREDSLVPANLQGIWNDSLLPPWQCDLHVDVNIQMNYWFVDQVGLHECFAPFHKWIDSIREVRREETRKELKTTKGWAFRTGTNHYGASTWHWMKGAAAWCANNMWDHYRFTNDQQYLAEIYPIFKELCEFWIEELKQLPDGTLVAPNSWSPERGPRMDGTSHEQQLIWDLFKNTAAAAKILDRDPDFAAKITEMRARLLGPKIGKWGQLQEWAEDIDNPKDKHRHLSHLMAVHPGSQISPLTTPELAKAAAVSLDARGDGGTGWSRAEKVIIWARLHDGERAHKLIRGFFNPVQDSFLKMSGGGVFGNMLCAHPPFQIDGNFGYAAGVCEMLVQSHMDLVHLLPALPTAWPDGHLRGIKATGNLTLDLTWKDGKLTTLTATSPTAQTTTFLYQGKKQTIQLNPNTPTPIHW